jgi:hypothetical protein
MEEKKKKQTKRKRVTSVSPNQNKPSSLAHKGTWQHVMDDFLFWKKAQGVSETTIKGYSNHIRHFFTRFEDIWGEDELIKQAIMEHIEYSHSNEPLVTTFRANLRQISEPLMTLREPPPVK